MDETDKQITEALAYVDAQIEEFTKLEAKLNELLEEENTFINNVKLRIAEVTLLALEDLGDELSTF